MVISETLIAPQILKKISCILWDTQTHTHTFIPVFTIARHWSLPWARLIVTTPSHAVSLRNILILYYHVRPCFASGVLPWGFPPKFYTHFPPICATLPTLLTVLHVSKKLWSPSFRCLLQCDVISILFGSNIFLKVLRSNCLVCVLPSVRGTKLHVVILYTFICTVADHIFLLLLLLLLLLLQSALQPLWVSACSTTVEYSQQEVFTECRCQRHVKPPTWRTSD